MGSTNSLENTHGLLGEFAIFKNLFRTSVCVVRNVTVRDH
jgi:hypothetical protein